MAAGEQPAVTLCIERYGGLIWSLARRYHRDAHEAEDAVQDVFIELWRSAHRYDPAVATEKTFVAMVARRRLIDNLRRRARRKPTVELTEAVDAPHPNGDGSHGAVEAADEAALARHAVSRLPEDQREAIKLAIDAGMSHSEIADKLGVPLGTVKTRIRRGLIAVRESLASNRLAGAAGVTS